MTYFGYNPTMINKYDQISKMEHPASGSHYLFEWLGFPGGYRAIVESDRQLEDEIVALRCLDRARVDLHTPYSPDDGVTYMQRTMEIGQTSTAYDSWILDQEGRLQLHSTFNLNPSASRDHPLVVLYATAKEHCHAFLVAALKVSDCCHKEPTLLSRVVTLMHCGWHTTDFHKEECVLREYYLEILPFQVSQARLQLVFYYAVRKNSMKWLHALMMEL